MRFEDLCVLIIVIAVFLFGGTALFVSGLKFLGIIKPCTINPKKWSQTTAAVKGSKPVVTKALGKQSGEYERFAETTIVYKVNNQEYIKHVRHLPETNSRIGIYYKNNNPNCFRLKSKSERNTNVRRFSGFFLCFLSICIFICGCIVTSEII